MATQKKKKQTKQEKKRLIISYERLPQADKEAFETLYEDGFTDYIQSVMRPDGTPLFVVPLETEENIYMVKVEVRVDSHLSEEEFDKEVLHQDKETEESIESIVNAENGKLNKKFELNHGDYSSLKNLEEAVAREDMDDDNFTSLEDIDIEDRGMSIDL
ncbi:MAG: hypothetical protein J6M30_02625 [Bacteroidales bacterium]|nr:hypothetical protein [Bacteroidales bacterium]